MLKGGAGVTSQALRPTGGSGASQRTSGTLGAVMVPTVAPSQKVRRATDATPAQGVMRAHGPERQQCAYSLVPAVVRMGQAPHGDAAMRSAGLHAAVYANNRVAPVGSTAPVGARWIPYSAFQHARC